MTTPSSAGGERRVRRHHGVDTGRTPISITDDGFGDDPDTSAVYGSRTMHGSLPGSLRGDGGVMGGRHRIGRDPFLTRVGVLVLAGVLLAPVVAALGNDDTEVVSAGGGAAVAMVGPIRAGVPDGSLPRAGDATTIPATTAPATSVVVAEPQAVTVTGVKKRACSGRYTARRGDYWIGIADRARTELRTLLRANRATVATPLYPGDRICLPVGARNPGPPPVRSKAVTPRPTAPRPTSPPTTAAPVAAKPAPKPAAPKPTQPPAARPPSSYSRDEVIAIIREVWPDNLEQRAIDIAWRESNWIPTAHNYCCHGLFQIYFNVHRSWLGWFGVTSPEGLYNPRINAMAAYYLYTRAGGWGPWGG